MSTRIYVGGIHTNVESKSIEKKFEKYGSILSVDLKEKKDIDGNILSKFAYINLEAETSQVLECVGFFNGALWKGCELKVELAKESFLDRLKRERESVKSSAGEEHAHQADASYQQKGGKNHFQNDSLNDEGQNYNTYNNNRFNKKDTYQNDRYNDSGHESKYNEEDKYNNKGNNYKSNFNEYEDYGSREKGGINSDSGKYDQDGFQNNKRRKGNYYDDNDVNGFKQRDFGGRSQYENNDGSKPNYDDDSDVNGFKQKDFGGRSQYGNNDGSKRKQDYQSMSDIPKPIEMIRYDPMKPNIANKKLKQVKISEPEVKNNNDQAEDIKDNVSNVVGKKKVEVFGKLDFSEATFKLSDALSANECPVTKNDVSKSKSEKKLKGSPIKPQDDKIVAKPNYFFISPDDPRLNVAISNFTKMMSKKRKEEFLKIKPVLCSESVLPKKNIKMNNRQRKPRKKRAK